MLIQCKECGSSVSDKAVFCPHCGFPLRVTADNAGRREGCFKRINTVIIRLGQYLKAALVFKDGSCPTFGMFVIQCTATIFMHFGICILLWLIGGAAEQYIPKPCNYFVALPILLIAIGDSYFLIRILFTFFPTLGKYEKYVQENHMDSTLVFKTFVLQKRRYKLYYWGFFVVAIIVWLIIAHIANGGVWSWMMEGNNYHPRRHW